MQAQSRAKTGTLALLALFGFGCILMSGLVGHLWCRARSDCDSPNQTGWNVASAAIIFVVLSFMILIVVSPDFLLDCARTVYQ